MNIQTAILRWYQKNKRELPWRDTGDPYAVLVSEMMLQQTRVETVLKYYGRFMRAFPDIRALAQAEETAVLNCWEGTRVLRPGAQSAPHRQTGGAGV